MSYPPILCLGEILIDRIADQIAPTIAQVESWTDYPGGAPANVACGLAKLGTASGFIGAVGRDDRGQQLIQVLTQAEVDISGVQVIPDDPTRTVLVLRDETGDREFAGFGTADGGITRDSTIFSDTQLRVAELPIAALCETPFLVIGSLGLATPHSRDAITHAIKIVRKHQGRIWLDVNWRSVFWPDPAIALEMIRALITQVHWLKLAEAESDWLFPNQAPQQIAARYPNLQGICVTLGDRGCRYWIQEHTDEVPAFDLAALKQPVMDTTGAGDSFSAGMLHQILHAQSLTADQARSCVVYANAVAAITTTQMGAITAQPTTDQVAAFLTKQKRLA
jgi:fructokinase